MVTQPQDSGAQVARRAAALADLLSRQGARLRRQAARHSLRPADAEDALQDACVQFLRRYNGPPALSDALPWMLVVIKRCAWAITARAERKHRSHIELLTVEPGQPSESQIVVLSEHAGPGEWAERTEMTASCLALLDRIKPDERTALLLVGLGYSYREIMARQGWTYTKLNRCLSEGRAALRELVARGAKSCR